MPYGYQIYYWVFEASQLENALAASDLSRGDQEAVRRFLHSQTCQRLGLLKTGQRAPGDDDAQSRESHD